VQHESVWDSPPVFYIFDAEIPGMLRQKQDKEIQGRETITPFAWLVTGLIFIVFFPAFLINLDDLTLIDDECIRALVAMEMNISGDYIVPTIGDEVYLKKPPLYNWILAGVFNLTGSQSEFIIRLPATIAIILFSLIIFYFVKREEGKRLAIATALGFATCGRILFYESQRGLIDLLFSIFIFLNFMFIYRMGREKKYLALFLGSYALTAVGFLFKGLPSLVFQGFTLIAWFLYSRDLKRLFNWRHLLGIVLFTIPVIAYYLAYFLHEEDVTLRQLFGTLLGESTRRTVVRFGVGETLLHLLTFPAEVFYHYLPWSLFLILLFRKGNITRVRRNDLFRYALWVFLLNILPYWSSPETFARYYLMLMPLAFMILFYLYLDEGRDRSFAGRTLDVVILIMAIGATLMPAAYLFMERFDEIPYRTPVVVLLILASSVFTVFYMLRRDRLERFLLIVLLLLITRLNISWFILPVNARGDERLAFKQDAIRAARISGDTPVIRYWPPGEEPTAYYGYQTASYLTLFYMTREKGQIIPCSFEKPGDSVLYLVRDTDLEQLGIPYETLEEFEGHSPPIDLVRFLPGNGGSTGTP
jgi:4-amino-4-deoxy-L-arabinose transferase-like glycosyltransferase